MSQLVSEVSCLKLTTIVSQTTTTFNVRQQNNPQIYWRTLSCVLLFYNINNNREREKKLKSARYIDTRTQTQTKACRPTTGAHLTIRKLEFMFAVSLIVAFLAAFSAGASKTFSDSPSSFLRSLNSLKPFKSSLIITSVHLIGGFVFGTYILGTYEQLIVKVDHDDRAKLVVGAFATIVGKYQCRTSYGTPQSCFGINTYIVAQNKANE